MPLALIPEDLSRLFHILHNGHSKGTALLASPTGDARRRPMLEKAIMLPHGLRNASLCLCQIQKFRHKGHINSLGAGGTVEMLTVKSSMERAPDMTQATAGRVRA